LADPAVASIFQDPIVSSKALESLINAILANSGDRPIGKVATIAPQGFHPGGAGKFDDGRSPRSFCLDIEATTDSGETILIEFQLRPFYLMNERALLYA
jgi:hypothetical protein